MTRATLILTVTSTLMTLVGCYSTPDRCRNGRCDSNSGPPVTAGCPSSARCRTAESSGYSGVADPIEAIADPCERVDDFCPDAVPARPGTYVQQWNQAMRCAAESDHFVIHRSEWFNGGSEPGPEGTRHLRQLAAELQQNGSDVVIEAEPVVPEYSDPSLAEAKVRTNQINRERRQVVISELQKGGLTDAEHRVHLGSLESAGIRGIEAPRVYNQQFIGGGRGGRSGQGGGSGGGGFGGGGGAIGGRGRVGGF